MEQEISWLALARHREGSSLPNNELLSQAGCKSVKYILQRQSTSLSWVWMVDLSLEIEDLKNLTSKNSSPHKQKSIFGTKAEKKNGINTSHATQVSPVNKSCIQR